MKGQSVTSCRRFICGIVILFFALTGFAKEKGAFPEHYRFFIEDNWGALEESNQIHAQQQYACHSEGWLNALESFILMDDRSSFSDMLHGCPTQWKVKSSFQRSSSVYLSYDSLLKEARQVFGKGEITEELVWKGVRAEFQYSIIKIMNQNSDLSGITLNADRSFQWLWILSILTPTLIIVVLLAKGKKPIRNQVKGAHRSDLPERVEHLLNVIEDQINSQNFSPHFDFQMSQLEFELKSSAFFSDDHEYTSLTHQQRLILHFASQEFDLNQVAEYLSISKGHLYNERSAIRRKLNMNSHAPMNSEARRWMISKSGDTHSRT